MQTHRVTCQAGNRITISCDEHRTPLTTVTTPSTMNHGAGEITEQYERKVRDVTKVS
jgi:hypothetical protein